jgi:hypothetical protein
MTWLEKRDNWLDQQRTKNGRLKVSKLYTVRELADIFCISKTTVYKWLSIDEPKYAVIPPNGWFKLPSGHIRIYEWVVIKLQKKEL